MLAFGEVTVERFVPAVERRFTVGCGCESGGSLLGLVILLARRRRLRA